MKEPMKKLRDSLFDKTLSLPELFKTIEDEGFIPASVALLFPLQGYFPGIPKGWQTFVAPFGGEYFFCELYIRARIADDCEQIDERRELKKMFRGFDGDDVIFSEEDHKKNAEQCIRYIEDRAIKGAINNPIILSTVFAEDKILWLHYYLRGRCA